MKDRKIRYDFLIPLSGADRKDAEGLKRIHEKDPFCLFVKRQFSIFSHQISKKLFCCKSMCKNFASTFVVQFIGSHVAWGVQSKMIFRNKKTVSPVYTEAGKNVLKET